MIERDTMMAESQHAIAVWEANGRAGGLVRLLWFADHICMAYAHGLSYTAEVKAEVEGWWRENWGGTKP